MHFRNISKKNLLEFCRRHNPIIKFVIKVIKSGTIKTYPIRYPAKVIEAVSRPQNKLVPFNLACTFKARLNGAFY